MADAIDTPSVPAPDAPSESLADHEASYAPGVERRAEPAETPAEPAAEPEAEAPDAERDETGKFKPRHRAKSQQASPEDVPRIRELTRKLRETEAQLEAARRPAPAAAAPAAPAVPARQEPAPQPKPVGFPPFDQWLTQDGNESKTFEEFMDARADWRYDQRRTAEKADEKADEARTAAERAFQTEADAYLKQLDEVAEEFPDFEDVVNPPDGPIRVSKVVERAVIKVGPRAAYYLATHPEERDALSEETAIDPNNPAFAATVAATRRYLSTLVASPQRATSSRAAAASTGSALALAPKPAPRPPNPVRTAALRDGDAMPTDESSLADHERAFGPGRRRA